MKKRILALLLAVTLLLFGCAPGQNKKSAVRIAVPSSPYIQDMDSNYYKQWLEEKTGVPIEFIPVRQQRSQEYLSALFASQDADIDAVFFGGGTGFTLQKEQLEKYVQNKKLLLLDPYLADGTNYASLLQQPGIKAAVTAQGGGIYFFPNTSSSRTEQNGQVLWLNYTWLKQLGLQIPTTPQQLKAVLTAFAQNDPNQNGRADELPLVGCQQEYSLETFNFLLNAFVYNDPYHSRVYAQNGAFYFAPVTDEFRQGLVYCRELYAQGLLDERSFTYTKKQIEQLVNSPENIVGGFTSSSISELLYQNNPEIMANYICVPPLIGENGQRNALYIETEPACGGVILAGSQRAGDAFLVLDTMLSKEASLIAEYGEEGVDWDYSDGTDISITGKPATIVTQSYIRQTLQNKNFSRLGPFYLNPNYIEGVTWNGVNSDARYIDTRASMNYEAFYPSEKVAFQTNADTAKIREALDDYTDEMIVRFITGSADVRDDRQWQAFQDNCETLGAGRLLDLCEEKP